MSSPSPTSSSEPALSQSSDSLSRQTYLSRPTTPAPSVLQKQLLVLAPKEPFHLKEDADIPPLTSEHEVLVGVDWIGLNPIDWKGQTFGYGLADLPSVLGRDFVGTVVETYAQNVGSGIGELEQPALQPGDVVICISTDYRDSRKGAFQQYAVASNFNLCRIPSSLHRDQLPALGVAFVTAALSLGVCLGVSFAEEQTVPGPDLYQIIRF